MRSALLVLVGLAVAGCSSPLDPKMIEGTWHEDFGGFPGSYFQMTLSSNGSDISGTGLGCGEAGPCGTSTIVGTSDSQGIHLTITSVTSVRAPNTGQVSVSRFDGHLYPGDFMIGKLRAIGAGDEIGLVDNIRYLKGSVVPTLQALNRAH